MPLRLFVVFLASAIVCSAQAQWTNTADPTLAGRAGIGGSTHSATRLRLTESQGALSTGPFFLTFGSASSLWWAYRLDAENDLHVDRNSESGWAEGFVFNRNGNFGIGTDTPLQLLHVSRDQNLGTIMRVNNANTGATAYSGVQYTQGATLKGELRSLSSGWVSATGEGPRANALELVNYTSGPTIFSTSGSERMRIFADGNVAIGGWNNSAKVTITSATDAWRGLQVTHRTNIEANVNQSDTGLVVQGSNDVASGVLNSGGTVGAQVESWNFGPGTMYWSTGGMFRAGNYWNMTGAVTRAYAIQAQVHAGAGTIQSGFGVYIHDTEAADEDYGVYQLGANDTNYFAGNVLIGEAPTAATTDTPVHKLRVQGDAYFNGTVTGTNIKAHYQDVAEWVPSTTDLAPGTVVILNTSRNNEVMASATSYDTTVAGVVSAQPGLSLGVEGDGKEQVATTGRVKVRVDARRQAIRVGDLLVTSDIPGTAMRSEPMTINGRAFHQPGTIIGKALEPLEGGTGEILVLLSMQ